MAQYSAPAALCAGQALLALARSDEPLSLAQLERAVASSKSLLFRVLRELEACDFLTRDAMGRYALGLAAFEIGAAYANQSPFVPVVRRVLQELARESGETINLGVLRGAQVLYVMKFPGRSAYVTVSRVGGHVPANCVAIGKALLTGFPEEEIRRRFPDPLARMTDRSVQTVEELLAELEVSRAAGYAIDREQAARGRCAIAVPVRLEAPELSGQMAISVSTSVTDFDARFAALLEGLLEARDRIERDGNSRAAWTTMGAAESSVVEAALGG
jgi:DNA-binding IclR family transcriptional regulator